MKPGVASNPSWEPVEPSSRFGRNCRLRLLIHRGSASAAPVMTLMGRLELGLWATKDEVNRRIVPSRGAGFKPVASRDEREAETWWAKRKWTIRVRARAGRGYKTAERSRRRITKAIR